MFKPTSRVTANLGYNLTSTSGETLILTPTQTTLGPPAINFHKPTASVDVELAKGFAWRTAWNYDDYKEKPAPGPLAPRDFQSNSATRSLRYAWFWGEGAAFAPPFSCRRLWAAPCDPHHSCG